MPGMQHVVYMQPLQYISLCLGRHWCNQTLFTAAWLLPCLDNTLKVLVHLNNIYLFLSGWCLIISDI